MLLPGRRGTLSLSGVSCRVARSAVGILTWGEETVLVVSVREKRENVSGWTSVSGAGVSRDSKAGNDV